MPRAVDTMVIRDLNDEWRQLAVSRRLRARLDAWAAADPVLAFDDPNELVAAAARRVDGQRSCAVLDGLVARSASDALALRVAVQAMLGRWCALIDRLSRGDDLDEVAALVVTVGTEMILACRPDTARTPLDMRLWSNTRRKVLRILKRERARPEDLTEQAELDRHDVQASTAWRGHDLEELLSWVAARAELDMGTARLVVLTRVSGVPLSEIAAHTGVAAATLRQRRHRAERRLAAAI